MKELAVIGEEAFALGFRLVGVRKIFGISDSGIDDVVDRAVEDRDIGIIIMHNDDYDRISPALRRKLIEITRPIIIPIGSMADPGLRERIITAVGVDLLK